jgi:type III secretion system FlhB-like substrate exporter
MSQSKEARMQMAISAYKNQKIKSKSKAAEIFGVPESTLRERLCGVKPCTETRANGHRMTVIEEKSLVKHLLDADKRGFSIRPEFYHGMAQILL